MSGGRLTAIALAVLLLGACSWITVSGPPSRPRPPQYDCTASKAAPVFDSVVTVAGGIVGVVGLLMMKSADGDKLTESFIGLIGATWAVGGFGIAIPFYFSSRHGYRRVNGCRRALDEDQALQVHPGVTVGPGTSPGFRSP